MPAAASSSAAAASAAAAQTPAAVPVLGAKGAVRTCHLKCPIL
jgi:hypothetical protein